MTNSKFNLVNSVLAVKASGSFDATNDLLLPEGKSIAQLLYDQEKETGQTQEEVEKK